MRLLAGAHYDLEFLGSVRRRLKAMFPSELNDTLLSYQNDYCDCASVDSKYTDPEDSTWCPHLRDDRTHVPLENILPILKKTLSNLEFLVDEIEARATISKDNRNQRVKSWLRTSTLVSNLSSTTPEVGPAASTPTGVQRMVPDVLVAIFHQAREDDPMAILRLGQVNKSFRDVALHTPLLWAKIDILQSTNIMTLHLERSLTVPLDVSLSLPPMFPDNEGMNRLYAFIVFIAPYSERIRSLNALQSYSTYIQLCFDFILSANLPLLKTLEVGLARPRNRRETPEAEPTRDSMSLALTSLSIRHIRIATHSNFISPFMTSLTLHETVFSTYPALIATLQIMSNLRSLHLEDLTITNNAEVAPPLILAELRNMTVIRSIPIRGVQTPKLDSAILSGHGLVHFPDDSDDTFPEKTPLDDILQGNPQLLHLHLSNTFLSRSQWKAAFQHLPLLMDVRLTRCNFPGDHLQEILGQPSPDWKMPSPRLQHLAIDGEQYVTSNAIVKTLIARSSNQSTTRLKTLTATRWLTSLIDSDDLDTLRQYVEVLAIGIIVHMEGFESSNEKSNGEKDGQSVDSNDAADDEENGAVASVGDNKDGPSQEENHESEEESFLSDSSSEGSWASGDEMVVRHQFQWEQVAHSSTYPP